MPHSTSTTHEMHPLQRRVEDVARRARRLRLMQAAGRWVAGVVVAVLAVGLVDYVLRVEDTGLRWMLSVGAVSFVAWWLVRTVAAAWRRQPTTSQVARRIEEFYPQLRDQLTSSLEFLEPKNAVNAGSAQLRQVVVENTASSSAALDFQQCVNPAPARRSLATVAVAIAVALAITLPNASLAARAAQRFIMPWGGPTWPRKNDLKYVDPPSRAARGDDVLVRVIDAGGRLPESGTLEIWYEGDERSEIQSLPMIRQGDELIAELDGVARTLSYRALAGDDRLSWWDLELVERPTLLNRVMRLAAPEYIETPPQDVRDTINALVGSSLSAHGEFSRPMKRASLVSSSGRRQTLRLDAAGSKFELEPAWTFDVPGVTQLWFEVEEWVDEPQQIGASIEVQVTHDTAPTISWELPADGHFATPQSQLPLRGVVKDNAAIAVAALLVEFSNGVRRRVDLSVANQPATAPRSLPFDRRLSLAEWGVRPGDELKLRLESHDFQPASPSDGLGNGTPGILEESVDPGLTQTDWRQIRIVSDEQMLQHVGQRRAEVFQRLEELLELQRVTERRTSEIHQGIGANIVFEDREALQNVELQQRRVTQGIGQRGNEQTGLIGLIGSVLDELQLSGAADDAQQRLTTVKIALQRVSESHAAEVERHLVAAVREAVAERESGPTMALLAGARNSQRALVSELESLLTNARQWTTYQQAAQELSRIIEQQSSVQAMTDDLHVQHLADPQSPNMRERGIQAAQDQAVLGRRFDRLLAELKTLESELRDADQQVVRHAIEKANTLQLSSGFRRCETLLQELRWGPALDAEEQLVADLRALLEALAEQADVPRQALRQLAADVRALEGQVRQAAAKWNDEVVSPQDQRAEAKRLAELAREAAETARQLAPPAAELIIDAHFRLAKAGLDSINGSPPSIEAVVSEANQAATVLAEAAEHIERQAAPNEQQTNLAKNMLEDVDSLIARQDLLRESLAQLSEDAPLNEFLERQQQQATLADELRKTLDRWTASDALRAGLARARQPMERAADDLRARRKLDADAAMALAASRLKQVHEVLAPQANTTPQLSPPSPPSTQATAAEDAANSLSNTSLRLPELKMLVTIQREVLVRTKELQAVKTRRALNAAELREQTDLASQQGQLAGWLNAMLEAPAPDQAVPDKPESSIDQLLDSFK